MPEMDGFEATWRIRDHRSAVLNPGVAVIALTADAMQGDREKCLEAGMNDYLSKPINVAELRAALEKWLPRIEAVSAAPQVEEGKTHSESGKDDPQKDAIPEPGDKGVDEISVFNEIELLERLMGDQELVNIVVTTFQEDMPRQINALKQSLASGDLTSAHRQAHTIKGASANLGAGNLRQAASEMEKLGSSSELLAVDALSKMLDGVPDLESRFKRLEHILQTRYHP